MDAYEEIEELMAKKYDADTTTRKATGDFMLSSSHAVNVKSNNVAKNNYSPNMISIKKMHDWVFEKKNELSFIFVDYEITKEGINILKESELIPIEHISWDCLSIEAQGYGVIQKNKDLIVDKQQSKSDFYKGFLREYGRYRQKETDKHDKFSNRFIANPDDINW